MKLPANKRRRDELGDSGDENDYPFCFGDGWEVSGSKRLGKSGNKAWYDEWKSPAKQARNAIRMRVSAPRRRIGEQYFLDFGQKDFSRTQCHVCGLMYAKGEEKDEKLHKAFHRCQTQGIQFKGWKTERVVRNVADKAGRVICVFPDDPPQHQHKVREAAAVMEKEMGLVPGWLLENQCKVYLFISAGKKIVGCLMAEDIQEAFAVVPQKSEDHGECSHAPKVPSKKQAEPAMRQEKPGSAEKNILVFGGWKFRREVVKRTSSQKSCNDQEGVGAVITRSKVPVPAVCGVRCMWVSKSERRTGIASHLLDALRVNFSMGCVLKPDQLAFSQPTSDGRAFAQRYFKTDKILVYG